MYLSELKLWNFRRFGSNAAIQFDKPDLIVPFNSGLNLLIGENDSGKTAIIDAIKLLLKTHSYDWVRLTWEDFYQNADRLRIEMRFDELQDDEAKNFTEWLSWEGAGENAKAFLRLIYDASRSQKDHKILPTDVRAGSTAGGSFLDPAAKDYLKSTYLKPLRDAETELIAKKGSRLSQILLGHDAFKISDGAHHLETIYQQTNVGVEKYFEGKNTANVDLPDQQGKRLKEQIDTFIKAFYDRGKESEFKASEAHIKDILEKLDLSIKDSYELGLGTLNRLFIAAELLHLHKSNWTGVRIGLIEEIEAHLHPQAQMQIIEALETIIAELGQKKRQLQLILTTHSPNIASKVQLKNMLICHGGHVFPMSSGNTRLDLDDYVFLERFLDVTKANLFFAKGVILVEGWSEEILIPSLAKRIKIDLTEYGVSIVNLGNTAFLRYSKIFQRVNEPSMEIPIAIITDLDKMPAASEDEKTEAAASKRAQYDGQKVKSFVSSEWTLEYCLAHSTSFGSKYQTILKAIHSNTDWTDFDAVLQQKLTNKSIKKTEAAYQLAHALELDLDATEPQFEIDHADPTISYLIQAIKYACRIQHQ